MSPVRKNIIEVGGGQVFTADAAMELMQAQSRRIDRAASLAKAAVAIGIVDFALLVLTIAIR